MDMSILKKETPGQKIHRLELILETIRSNQCDAADLLSFAGDLDHFSHTARSILRGMYKQDRDILLWDYGIFTEEQLRILRNE